MIVLATAVLLAIGFVIAWRAARSPINGTTVTIWAMILLELVPAWFYIHATKSSAPPAATATLAALYTCYGLALCLAFASAIKSPVRRAKVNQPKISRLRALCLILLFGAADTLVIGRISSLTHITPFSRAFYVATRLGWGSMTFTAELAAFAILILALTALRGQLRVLLCAAAVVILATFGAKGPPVTAVAITTYFVALRQTHLRLRRALPLAALAAVSLYSAFWLYSPGSRSHLANFFIAYSDPARNLLLEIKTWDRYNHGELTLEQNLYVLVPRSLDTSKPEFFGDRLLAGYYFPKWVEKNQGDPSFSRFGLTWADFGPIAIALVIIFGALQGWLLGLLETRLRASIRPAEFIAYLALAGLEILNPGSAAFLVLLANVSVGVILDIAVSTRIAQRERGLATYETAS